jgi:P27 family predicted phage terminase small subunit
MAGRKRKPSAIRLVEGNAGHRPINKREPKPQRGIPSCPKHLSKRAKQVYRRVGRLLDDVGVITKADWLALELLVSAYDEYRDARELIADAAEDRKFAPGQLAEAKDGLIYKTFTQNGVILRPHPANALATNAFRRTVAMLGEFGLTPASRAKVSSIGDDNAEDPLEAFLQGDGASKRA